MKRLQNLGQIEISVSSLYHPILPLLCNTDSALEAMPGNKVPNPPFIFPEDAEYHLHESVKFYERNFQSAPNGMWPSEGSISDEALELIVKSGIHWIATDEQIMMETLNNSVNRLERFFPRKFNSKSGDITILFRDHFLSDIIGFNYSRWDAKDAATDFINRLKYVRWEISSQYGEDSIKNAVVPIILDGENCWEFFKENGKPFLEELYKQFSECEELKTITVSEAILEAGTAYVEPISHVRAGSWINANFHIWIGQDEHVKAWEMLREARVAVKERKDLIASEAYDKAMKEIYISEGSDWFWWYCDSHQAPNKKDFDVIYRKHLVNIYNIIGLVPPENLNHPIGAGVERKALKMPENEINPQMNGLKDDNLWSGAGVIDAGAGMDAMHSSGEILDKILFGANDNKMFFRVDCRRKLRADETVILNFNSNKYKIVISNEAVVLDSQNEVSELIFSIEETCTFSIDRNLIGNEFELSIKTKIPDGEVFYPRQGYFPITIWD
jgi:alpha-amylase/alpha-mannosidase (GH57 family)